MPNIASRQPRTPRPRLPFFSFQPHNCGWPFGPAYTLSDHRSPGTPHAHLLSFCPASARIRLDDPPNPIGTLLVQLLTRAPSPYPCPIPAPALATLFLRSDSSTLRTPSMPLNPRPPTPHTEPRKSPPREKNKTSDIGPPNNTPDSSTCLRPTSQPASLYYLLHAMQGTRPSPILEALGKKSLYATALFGDAKLSSPSPSSPFQDLVLCFETVMACLTTPSLPRSCFPYKHPAFEKCKGVQGVWRARGPHPTHRNAQQGGSSAKAAETGPSVCLCFGLGPGRRGEISLEKAELSGAVGRRGLTPFFGLGLPGCFCLVLF
ncbi:hypothetical protein BS50DRAFT_84782 [Corynespora cassiicola Philippines]|uniref:Uncharacterized protein n=1 Tax=Corynespora cassiicola Philippines TaxID=1448308 RepID=A0A2T2NDT7_CORCC|nr:hypothetical protein BS50DRAFT_84782 [Corynespora cassiicola Philippines]